LPLLIEQADPRRIFEMVVNPGIPAPEGMGYTALFAMGVSAAGGRACAVSALRRPSGEASGETFF